MRIYLIRHGETVLNQRGCYYGESDAALNEKGVNQAQAFRAFFSEFRFDYVISSPLKRARNTAEIILGDGEEKKIITDCRLKEQNFGIFEGYTYKELTEKYPEKLRQWNENYSDFRIPGGESFRDVRKRVEDFALDLPRGDGVMLLAAHKGTLGHFMAAVLHMPLEGYWNFVFEQGCYNCIDMEDGYAIVRKLNQSIFK